MAALPVGKHPLVVELPQPRRFYIWGWELDHFVAFWFSWAQAFT